MSEGKIIYQGKTKKGRQLIIRYPKINDTQRLLDYINTLSKERTFIRFQGEQLSFTEEKKYLEDFIEKTRKKKAVKLLVLDGSKLIGVADINLMEKVESHVGVFGITVARDFRGEGIGKLLMRLTIEEAKKNIIGLKIITLGCFANNDLAYQMYKKSGFVEYGRLPQGISHQGQYIDHIHMLKNI